MNIFSIPENTRPENSHRDAPEFFQPLVTGPGNLLVERIISHGHTTPPGEWYNQERDEWVVVLRGEARIGYEDETEVTLKEGDTLFLPQYLKHRVAYTSSPCIWLAIHGCNLAEV